MSGLVSFFWWTDDVGASIISAYIIFSWVQNSWEHVKKLVGQSAPPEVLSKLTYLAYNYHPKVLKIDTVQAFYIGQNLFVEIDVVLDEDMKLKEAHDIGEGLQKKIEEQEDVERAYIHLDYEYDHNKDDEHKIIV